MESTVVVKIAAELMLAAVRLTGYPPADSLPNIHRVAPETVQQMACGRPCRVSALYDSTKGVYISNNFDLDQRFARSVLLHELVHHLQRVHGQFGGEQDQCKRAHAEEVEAYWAQNMYLQQYGMQLGFVPRMLPNTCQQARPVHQPRIE